MTRFTALLLLPLYACGGLAADAPELTESTKDVTAAVDLPPGRHLLRAPLSCESAECLRACPEVASALVDVSADGSASVGACPSGWACTPGVSLPLGETYSPTLPKSGGTVCSYDVGAGSWQAESAPAVVRGGFVDPPAESPASHDLELSDGDTSYRVMFGAVRSGQAIADRINAVTGATIEAHVSEGGILFLTSVESGPEAQIVVLRGAALPMLGLEGRPSGSGR